jgi:uncharacterized protein (TIGR03083 family)
MVPERPVDCGALYQRKRRELIATLRSLDDGELATPVPATPGWRVRDVGSHLVGLCADMNAGVFGVDDPDAWTANQVAARRDHSVDELAAEWELEAPVFEHGLRVLGYELGSHYVADLLQHVADVAHALERPAPVDDDALPVALDFYLISFERGLREANVGAVAVAVGQERWTLGEGDVVASVSADRFELFRSLGGRRSAAQIRALRWDGDLEAVFSAVSRYPMPADDLVEVHR